MLLSRVTAHKITNFRCKYLATMAMGDDDDDNNEDGFATTMATAYKICIPTRRVGTKSEPILGGIYTSFYESYLGFWH